MLVFWREFSMRNFDTADDFRAHADECLKLAELSLDSENRQRWLALAGEWLDLAETFPAVTKHMRLAS
jgi:hypothetical protein